jgi:hypothetical protein
MEHLAFEQGAIDQDHELDSLKAAHRSLSDLCDTISFGEVPQQARVYFHVRCAPPEGRDIRVHSAIISFGLTGQVNVTTLAQRE